MKPSIPELEKRIDTLASIPAGEALPHDAREAVDALLDALEAGEVRAASRGDDGTCESTRG